MYLQSNAQGAHKIQQVGETMGFSDLLFQLLIYGLLQQAFCFCFG